MPNETFNNLLSDEETDTLKTCAIRRLTTEMFPMFPEGMISITMIENMLKPFFDRGLTESQFKWLHLKAREYAKARKTYIVSDMNRITTKIIEVLRIKPLPINSSGIWVNDGDYGYPTDLVEKYGWEGEKFPAVKYAYKGRDCSPSDDGD
jgi:hypothetical protein